LRRVLQYRITTALAGRKVGIGISAGHIKKDLAGLFVSAIFRSAISGYIQIDR